MARSSVVAAGVASSALAVFDAEPLSLDEKATQLDVDAQENVLLATAKQVYKETYGGDLPEGTQPITEQGREKREAQKQEQRDAFLATVQERNELQARRDEWLARTHEFAGLRMSGHDLDRLIASYTSNPEMRDRLRQRLVTNGRSEKDADRTVDAFDQYIKLLQKESRGEKLSPEEERRKLELSRNPDVRDAAKDLLAIQTAERTQRVTSENVSLRAGVAPASTAQGTAFFADTAPVSAAEPSRSGQGVSFAHSLIDAAVSPRPAFKAAASGQTQAAATTQPVERPAVVHTAAENSWGV